ncbi:hypothetical protein AU468_06215 [Alkalispirochaeta sphaeroplastigenens]|uniref:Uncharacterized protein n=1 Tax=Alkalispirochaeta sphaeroplastigenens TaxID=1187066 RepID=A0A2S4JSX9_9SPIO|nr:hypothetical protein [Alkalispirochaeta sphaeroplastigenens]POR02626.1 hypothetical protein AU468_06215 [Alkalispirochaeta sphaeroplastigenens]
MEQKALVVSLNQWDAFDDALKRPLEEVFLLPYLRRSRWFRDKSRCIRELVVIDRIPCRASSGEGRDSAWLLVVRVICTDGHEPVYFLPLGLALGEEAARIKKDYPPGVVASVECEGEQGICFEGLCSRGVQHFLLQTLLSGTVVRGSSGAIEGLPAGLARREIAGLSRGTAQLLRGEQSNSALLYQDRAFLKVYRALESGENPEVEILRCLATADESCPVPRYLGSLGYRFPGGEKAALALLMAHVPNKGDGWEYVTEEGRHFFNHLLQRVSPEAPGVHDPVRARAGNYVATPGTRGRDFLEKVSLLAHRTASLHRALLRGSEGSSVDSFRPEPFTPDDHQWLVSSLRVLIRHVTSGVRQRLADFPEAAMPLAEDFIAREEYIHCLLADAIAPGAETRKIRLHGDYHLGQVLFTGDDFILTDFEGEPARPLGERRKKGPALRDVAGMLRSFHYAVSVTCHEISSTAPGGRTLPPSLREWWYRQTREVFLKTYQEEVRGLWLVPGERADFQALLRLCLLEKVVYEIGYELDNRPEWIWIPLEGIRFLLDQENELS